MFCMFVSNMATEVAPLKEYKNSFRSNTIYNRLADLILKANRVADLNTVDPEVLTLPLTIYNILTEFGKPQLKVVFRESILPKFCRKFGLKADFLTGAELVVVGMLIKNKNTPLMKKDFSFYHHPYLRFYEQNLAELSEDSKKRDSQKLALVETIFSGEYIPLHTPPHELHFLGVNYSIPELTKLNNKITSKKFIEFVDEDLTEWINYTYKTPKGKTKAGKEENYNIINNVRKDLDSLLATPEDVSEVLGTI